MQSYCDIGEDELCRFCKPTAVDDDYAKFITAAVGELFTKIMLDARHPLAVLYAEACATIAQAETRPPTKGMYVCFQKKFFCSIIL